VGKVKSRAAAAVLAAVLLQLPMIAVAGAAHADAPGLGNQTIERIAGPVRPSAAASNFGASVALSDDGLTALVGDPNDQTAPGATQPVGTVRAYTRTTVSSPWSAPTVLAHTPVPFDRFGLQVALSGNGNLAMVGQIDTVAGAFAVVAYRRSGANWLGPDLVHLGPSDGSGPNDFALNADGTVVVVRDNPASLTVVLWGAGEWQRGPVIGTEFGYSRSSFALARNARVVVFKTHAGPSVVGFDDHSVGQPRLLPHQPGDMLEFTYNFAISGDGRTVAASFGSNTSRLGVWGATANGDWYQQATFEPPPDAGLYYAWKMAFSRYGDRLMAADAGWKPAPNAAVDYLGHVVAYERAAGAWIELGDITSPDAHDDEFFGSSLAMTPDGSAMLIGARDFSAATSASVYSWLTDLPASDGNPDARDDAFTTTANYPAYLDVIDNDGGGELLDVSFPSASDEGGTVGPALYEAHRTSYTPPVDFIGVDHVTYTVCDDDQVPNCDSATVTITVGPTVPFDEAAAPTLVTGAKPLVGDFVGDAHDDVYWYRAGVTADSLWQGGAAGFTGVNAVQMDRVYSPIVGDFDGNSREDILWYAPGSGREALWRTSKGRFLPTSVPAIDGTYTPVVGDFTGDRRDDVLWYAPGPTREVMWRGTATGFTAAAAPAMSTTYTPVVGDFDVNGTDDIFWYAPGATRETMWKGTATGFASAAAPSVSAAMTPLVGTFDAEWGSDVLWYAANGREVMWSGGAGGFTTVPVPAMADGYTPIVHDFNYDHRTDVLWYGAAALPERLWRGGDGFTIVTPPAMNAIRNAVAGNFGGSPLNSFGDVLWYRAGSTSTLWYGRPR
jgi:hypothetical protein